MRRPAKAALQISGLAVVLILATRQTAFAQAGSASSESEGKHANQIPLSGRSPQGGSVVATQSPVPGTTTSVNTINPAIQVQGPYTGSVGSTARIPFSGRLSLQEAVQRGLEHNLGTIGLTQAVRQARGQSKVAKSALLPNLNGRLSETVQQINLKALGVPIGSSIPGLSVPTIVGPFNYFDLRATLSQTLVDLTAWHNYRSSAETLLANELSVQDARDLVVLAVGGSYLQLIAAKAKVESARVQLETARALYQQTSERRSVGLVAHA